MGDRAVRPVRLGDSFKQVDSTKGQNSFGIGGRVGYFLSDKWNLEVDGSANPTDIESAEAKSIGMVYMPFHAGVNYNAPISNKVSWFVGPRVAYNRYSVSDAAADYLEKGYEGSGMNPQDPQWNLQPVAQYAAYRGLVFATLDAQAPDLVSWLGGAATDRRTR